MPGCAKARYFPRRFAGTLSSLTEKSRMCNSYTDMSVHGIDGSVVSWPHPPGARSDALRSTIWMHEISQCLKYPPPHLSKTVIVDKQGVTVAYVVICRAHHHSGKLILFTVYPIGADLKTILLTPLQGYCYTLHQNL